MFRKIYSITPPIVCYCGNKIWRKTFIPFQKEKNEVVFNDPANIKEIAEREMGGIQHLTGYVVTSLINKIKSKKHHGDSELNEQMLLVLQACKIHYISEQKLIACQARGGLTGVNVECQKIFIIAEQRFRAYTSAHHLNINYKITSGKHQSYQSPKFIVDCNSYNKLNEEVKLNVLEQMLKLHIRVRSFSYAKDFTNKQKQHSSNQKRCIKD